MSNPSPDPFIVFQSRLPSDPKVVGIGQYMCWSIIIDEDARIHVLDLRSGAVLRAKVMDLELIARASDHLFKECHAEGKFRQSGGA